MSLEVPPPWPTPITSTGAPRLRAIPTDLLSAPKKSKNAEQTHLKLTLHKIARRRACVMWPHSRAARRTPPIVGSDPNFAPSAPAHTIAAMSVDKPHFSPTGALPDWCRCGCRVASVAALLIAIVATAVRAADEPSPGRIARRIVTIAPNSAQIVCELGACDRIVGVSKFCVYPPSLADRPRVGGLFDPDLERITSLRPDLVVLRGRSDSIEQLCRRSGIDLYRDETDTIGGITRCIVELGHRLGLAETAGTLVERLEQRIEAIRQRVAGRPRPRVMLTVSRQPDRMSDILTTGNGTFLDETIEIAGGTNAFGDIDMRYPQVSAESIVAKRPDVIIELMPGVKATPAWRSRMLDRWKRLGSVPAVAHNRVYFLTDDHCLIPSPRYVEIIEKISRLIHPEPDRDG